MVELKRHARLLYLLALFQLLGGPLVLGGLMMVSKLMSERQMTLAQSVSATLHHMDGLQDTLAGGAEEWSWTQDHGLLPPAKPQAPQPRKLKDGKEKLWVLNDLARFSWAYPGPLQTWMRGWHDPVPPRLAHAPPIPPPRWA